jgi:hypothetical protein
MTLLSLSCESRTTSASPCKGQSLFGMNAIWPHGVNSPRPPVLMTGSHVQPCAIAPGEPGVCCGSFVRFMLVPVGRHCAASFILTAIRTAAYHLTSAFGGNHATRPDPQSQATSSAERATELPGVEGRSRKGTQRSPRYRSDGYCRANMDAVLRARAWSEEAADRAETVYS